MKWRGKPLSSSRTLQGFGWAYNQISVVCYYLPSTTSIADVAAASVTSSRGSRGVVSSHGCSLRPVVFKLGNVTKSKLKAFGFEPGEHFHL